jgi:ribose 5-phosphate isomerase A
VTQEPQSFHETIERALDMVKEGDVVGLGSGRAATAFIQLLGVRARSGLQVSGVPTSEATAGLARQLGIQLASLDDIAKIDIAIDGADEVDPQLNLIKGYGGAHIREKIVATVAKRFVILVGPEKLVPVLGSRGRLPIEVVPFALGACRRRLAELGYPAVPRYSGQDLLLSDNGNYILDCQVSAIPDPTVLNATIRDIPGVVGTGLFIGMAHTVLIQRDATVEIRRRE